MNFRRFRTVGIITALADSTVPIVGSTGRTASAIISTAAFAAVLVAYAFLRGPSIPSSEDFPSLATPSSGDVEPSPSLARAPEASERADAPTAAQQTFRAMTAAERNSIFRLAIRDRGDPCPEATSGPEAGERLAVWRVTCGFAQSYLVGVDSDGQLFVEPMPYSEGGLQRAPVRIDPEPPSAPPR